MTMAHAGCDLDTSGSKAEYHVTEDTKEDRRPKTNRTVNDRVALQKEEIAMAASMIILKSKQSIL